MNKDSGNLVISRKQGEALVIGKEIRVSIASIKGKQVQLRIEAPRNILVSREEIAHLYKNDYRESE